MKLALLLNAIDPAIGGVLIRGDRGTAKSTAARALAGLLPHQQVIAGCTFGCDPDDPDAWCQACNDAPAAERRTTERPMTLVELPLNASEDRVVGSIDLEAALREGARRFEPGVLAQAHRNILYVDEVNLLDDHIVDVLLDAAASGVSTVEREGISVTHPSRFILVGTMNPHEGDLRPQLLDRFGLCVEVTGIRDMDKRIEIADQIADWEADPVGFAKSHAEGERGLRERILEARHRLSAVESTALARKLIAGLSISLQVEGHRADLVCARAARALAALDGAGTVHEHHVYEVAGMVYAHRRAPHAQEGTGFTELLNRIMSAEGRRGRGLQPDYDAAACCDHAPDFGDQ
jgi:Mg-chelatase subunit ChlI